MWQTLQWKMFGSGSSSFGGQLNRRKEAVAWVAGLHLTSSCNKQQPWNPCNPKYMLYSGQAAVVPSNPSERFGECRIHSACPFVVMLPFQPPGGRNTNAWHAILSWHVDSSLGGGSFALWVPSMWPASVIFWLWIAARSHTQEDGNECFSLHWALEIHHEAETTRLLGNIDLLRCIGCTSNGRLECYLGLVMRCPQVQALPKAKVPENFHVLVVPLCVI